MNRHFKKAFEHFDAVFRHADMAFRCADRPVINRGGIHTVAFKSGSLRERLRLGKKFLGMGLQMLFTGKTILRFKDRNAPGNN